MKKVNILAILILVGQSSLLLASPRIRDFQTSRLISTGGAGVASILSTEAAILNPAASAFFDGSGFSYQSFRSSLRSKNELRNTTPDPYPKQNTSQGLFMADHSGPTKGGVAYITQKENKFERERMVAHAAAAINQNTSMGVSYNYIKDTLPAGLSGRHKIEHQASVGLTHIIDEDTILGLVVIDPTRTSPGEERAIAGFQYDIADRFTLIGDVGTQYTKNTSKKYLWRAAVQLNVFSDFFVRVGQFYDNVYEFKGTGWGASWIGPRFGVEFSQKFSDQIGTGSYLYKDESIVDTALSAIVKF